MITVGNAFSLNMLTSSTTINMQKLTTEEAIDIVAGNDITSIVGHIDTSAVFSNILGKEIPANRTSFTWENDDPLLIGQYTGPRLPEGATTLPEGATITWWLLKK